MLTFAEKVREMTAFMKEVDKDGVVPTQAALRKLVADLNRSKIDKDVKNTEEYRKVLRELYYSGLEEEEEKVKTENKETKKSKTKEATMGSVKGTETKKSKTKEATMEGGNMLTFAKKVKEMTAFMKEVEKDTMPTKDELRKLVADLNRSGFDRGVKTTEEYRKILKEVFNSVLEEEVKIDGTETKKSKTKEVTMSGKTKKKAPVITVATKLLTKDLIKEVITNPDGSHYYFDVSDKTELSTWIAEFINANADYGTWTLERFNKYLTELETGTETVEKGVTIYEVTPEEVARYTTKKEDIMNEPQREERRMTVDEVMELYNRVFITYHSAIPQPTRRKIKEITIKYMTATIEQENGTITYQPVLREGRVVGMILGGYTIERICRWIDKKAEKYTRKSKLYVTDGAKLKAMSAHFYNEYVSLPITDAVRNRITELVKETEGKKSTVWWYVVMGITPEDYRRLKYPQEADTIDGYIKAHEEEAKVRKAEKKVKVKKAKKTAEPVVVKEPDMFEEAKDRYGTIRKGLKEVDSYNKQLVVAVKEYEKMKKELEELKAHVEEYKKAAGEAAAKKVAVGKATTKKAKVSK